MDKIDPLIHYAEILRIRQRAARRNSIFFGALLMIFILEATLFFQNEFQPYWDIVIISAVLGNFLLAFMSQITIELTNKSLLELIEVLQRRT